MEEILASIKRVIADDGRTPASPPAQGARRYGLPDMDPEPEQTGEPETAEEEDVLELSNPISDDDGLTSPDTTVAARQSLAALAALKQQAEPEPGPAPAGDGPLEAVVREMLRPMLKEWLDQNLPEIVQALVTREIARITRQSL